MEGSTHTSSVETVGMGAEAGMEDMEVVGEAVMVVSGTADTGRGIAAMATGIMAMERVQEGRMLPDGARVQVGCPTVIANHHLPGIANLLDESRGGMYLLLVDDMNHRHLGGENRHHVAGETTVCLGGQGTTHRLAERVQRTPLPGVLQEMIHLLVVLCAMTRLLAVLLATTLLRAERHETTLLRAVLLGTTTPRLAEFEPMILLHDEQYAMIRPLVALLVRTLLLGALCVTTHHLVVPRVMTRLPAEQLARTHRLGVRVMILLAVATTLHLDVPEGKSRPGVAHLLTPDLQSRAVVLATTGMKSRGAASWRGHWPRASGHRYACMM